MTSQHDELAFLLLDWEDGTLDADGIQRVREILKADSDARSFFLQQQVLGAALQFEGDAELGQSAEEQALPVVSTPAKEPMTPLPPRLRLQAWKVAAAVLMIGALAGRVLFLELTGRPGASETASITGERPQGGESQEATSQGVALVTRLVDIEWSPGQSPVEVGDAIVPGRFAIQSGYAQVEFFCGATVVLEGPAELDLKSPSLARVHSGRLRAQVPPAARGFSLETDDLMVVDLGTEFGLSVSPEGADVQVFDGEVELHSGEVQKQVLMAGQSLVRNAEGVFEPSESHPDQFLDIAALETRARGQRTARYEQWKSWSDRLRRDPRLIAYYAFDETQSWERRLPSDIEPANSELDGAIVGARPVTGRWGAKQALEFKQPGDRVRVEIPGEFSSLTFACWVRIDSLDRWYNSLFLTDDYNQGEPHWQILESGQMYFSVRPTKRGATGPHDQKVLSPPFWQPSMSGKWLHLATAYNAQSGRTTHFLNGEVLHTETLPAAQVVKETRIGPASIGNWSLPTRPDADFAIRNLNGSIDEFAIFAAALTEEEIQEMYQHGKP